MRRVLAAVAAVLLAAAAHAARRDVVFVLGTDRAPGGYYDAAAAWYAARWPQATLVRGARTLGEVREALAQGAGAEPWGRVVLIAHGSEWTGLGVPLFFDGADASPWSLRAALEHDEFPALPDAVLDGRSVILLESCGLGRRRAYLRDLSVLFGGRDAQRPQVRASTRIVWFGADAQRRELAYRTRWLRGAPDAARVNAAAAALDALVPERVLRFPVQVHLTAAAGSDGRPRLPAGFDAAHAATFASGLAWTSEEPTRRHWLGQGVLLLAIDGLAAAAAVDGAVLALPAP